MRSAAFRALRAGAISVSMALILFFLVEGACSAILLARELWWNTRPVPKERLHTSYDPMLGWVNRPGTRVPNLYGPGKSLTINSSGFRGAEEVSREIPRGRLRIICSGDSFTLGYGEADEATWCARLAKLEPALQTVNMGQGGYGADQAYLWYARDGILLEQDVLIFALITEDLGRMKGREFQGYGKPTLEIINGSLAPRNVPVPRASFRFPWWRQHALHFSRLRTLELIRTVLREDRTTSTAGGGLDPEAWSLVLEIFRSLRRLTESRGAMLVLVALPDPSDYRVTKSDGWRAALATEASLEGVLRVDLVEEIRRLPAAQVPLYFNSYLHYSEAGNHWVAEVLRERLMANPEFSRRLAERSRGVE